MRMSAASFSAAPWTAGAAAAAIFVVIVMAALGYGIIWLAAARHRRIWRTGVNQLLRLKAAASKWRHLPAVS